MDTTYYLQHTNRSKVRYRTYLWYGTVPMYVVHHNVGWWYGRNQCCGSMKCLHGSRSCYCSQYRQQKIIFLLYKYFLKVHLHQFSKMLEGYGSRSIPLTRGSGSRKPINMWILRIRIHNTGRNLGTEHNVPRTLLPWAFAGERGGRMYP